MSVEDRFQRLVDADVAAWPQMPGRLLHVLAPGVGVDLEVAAGTQELGDGPLQPGSRFRIASVTKPFVATAAQTTPGGSTSSVIFHCSASIR